MVFFLFGKWKLARCGFLHVTATRWTFRSVLVVVWQIYFKRCCTALAHIVSRPAHRNFPSYRTTLLTVTCLWVKTMSGKKKNKNNNLVLLWGSRDEKWSEWWQLREETHRCLLPLIKKMFKMSWCRHSSCQHKTFPVKHRLCQSTACIRL